MPMRLVAADLRIQEARESIRQIEQLIFQSWTEGKSTSLAEAQRALMLQALNAMEEHRAILASQLKDEGQVGATTEDSFARRLSEQFFARFRALWLRIATARH